MEMGIHVHVTVSDHLAQVSDIHILVLCCSAAIRNGEVRTR